MYLILKLKLFFLLILPISVLSQNQLSFISPDTVCVGEAFEIVNTSDFSNNVIWNFCSNDFTSTPEGGVINGINSLTLPVYIDIKKEGNDYFAFVTNITSKLVRLKFENTISSQPSVTNLGSLNNILISQTEGIQLINDNGNWWGFIVGGVITTTEERLIRLNFGNSLQNIPIATNLGNVGELSFPHDLFITKENNEWWGYVINANSNSITKLFFGNDLSNEPFGINIGNVGELNYPTGLFPFLENTKKYIFVTNEGDGTITRLDFGNLISSFPTGQNLGDLDVLQNPRDIVINKNCKSNVGFIVDKASDHLVKIDFGEDIESIPTATSFGNVGGFDFPHSISAPVFEEDEAYYLIPNANNNSLSRIKFPNCNQANPTNSNSFNPPSITFDEVGTFTLTYTSDLGSASENSICKEIVVIDSPSLNLGNDTTVCTSSLTINTNQENIVWQNGSTTPILDISETGWYSAEAFNNYCSTSSIDSIYIEFINCKSCLIFPNTFTPDGDQVNDLFEPFIKCDNNIQNYELVIHNRWGQKIYKSKEIQSGWDGRHNNQPVPSDVYVWLVNYSYFNGEKLVSKKLSGDLTLIR